MTDGYNKAIKLLARRDYSTTGIKKKLLEKEVSLIEIHEAIERLKEQNYLNDERYLEGRLRHYAKSKKGPEYIIKHCLAEGFQIDRSMINDVYLDLGLKEATLIQYHVKKFTLFNRLDWSGMSWKEKQKYENKLRSHLLSKGFKVVKLDCYTGDL